MRRFAADGAKPVLVDVDDARGLALALELDALYLRCDVGDKAQVDALVAQTLATLGRIQFQCQRLATRIVHIHNHRLGAIGSKPAHTRLPNTLRTAGDDANPTLVAEMDRRSRRCGDRNGHGRGC